MKNLIEGMTSLIIVSVISYFLVSLFMIELVLIKNQNIFYREYEMALVRGEENQKVSHDFSISLPFVLNDLNYTIEGYTR